MVLAFSTPNHRALSKGVATKQLCLFQAGNGTSRSAVPHRWTAPPLEAQPPQGTQRVNPVPEEFPERTQCGNFPDRQADRQLPPLSTDVCLRVAVLRANTGARLCDEREPKARTKTRPARAG